MLHIYDPMLGKPLFLPLFDAAIPAGFPSPADDYLSNRVDLNEMLIKHPAATFYAKASGRSMEGAKIFDGDWLIIDRAVPPRSGLVVVALTDGGFTVKRLVRRCGQTFLVAENPDFAPLQVGKEGDEDTDGCEIWGVVLHVIHTVK